MSNALFAFDDPADGQRAADRLRAALPAVELHTRGDGPHHAIAAEADELATGGFLTNLLDLFQGVFEWGASPHDASSFAEVVRRGGAVLSVVAETDAQCDRADEVAAEEGCRLRTGWGDAPQAGEAAVSSQDRNASQAGVAGRDFKRVSQ